MTARPSPLNGSSAASSSDCTCCRTRRMFASASTRSLMLRAKASRSTARALPAGTRQASAASINWLPKARISALSSPTPEVGSSDRRELEHTSSARWSLTWAGERNRGFCSKSSTVCPERARRNAHSQPARPPPTTAMDNFCIYSPLRAECKKKRLLASMRAIINNMLFFISKLLSLKIAMIGLLFCMPRALFPSSSKMRIVKRLF